MYLLDLSGRLLVIWTLVPCLSAVAHFFSFDIVKSLNPHSHWVFIPNHSGRLHPTSEGWAAGLPSHCCGRSGTRL